MLFLTPRISPSQHNQVLAPSWRRREYARILALAARVSGGHLDVKICWCKNTDLPELARHCDMAGPEPPASAILTHPPQPQPPTPLAGDDDATVQTRQAAEEVTGAPSPGPPLPSSGPLGRSGSRPPITSAAIALLSSTSQPQAPMRSHRRLPPSAVGSNAALDEGAAVEERRTVWSDASDLEEADAPSRMVGSGCRVGMPLWMGDSMLSDGDE